MWEIFLATVISLSAGIRQPRQVPTAPFDYELSYKIENQYKGLDLSFRHDYEREDGDFFNDIGLPILALSVLIFLDVSIL